MTLPLSVSGIATAASQAAVVLASFFVLALLPPPRGDMLLVPLLPGAAAPRLAFESGATVLGAGRFGGVVVRGERRRIAATMLAAGVLPVAASRVLCGDGATR